MPHGAFRQVILLGKYAVKFPRLRYALMAMRCNRWEREMWRRWRPLFKWKTLCPIHFADPWGLLVVMPRAIQPVTREAIESLPDYYPDISAELKHEDYGYVHGQLVALDYGLPFAEAVNERRSYFASFNGREAVDMSP